MSVKVYNLNYVKDMPTITQYDVSGINLGDLLECLENEYGPEVKRTLLTDGRLAERARVSINGRLARSLNDAIPDGGQVMFSLMLPGG